VINGQKRFITGGGLADYLTLFAITDASTHPHKGMSTFIVPMDAPGVRIRRQIDEALMGDIIDNVWLDLHDVEVPDDALLGPLNGGWQVLMDELDTERVTYCMAALGARAARSRWPRSTRPSACSSSSPSRCSRACRSRSRDVRGARRRPPGDLPNGQDDRGGALRAARVGRDQAGRRRERVENRRPRHAGAGGIGYTSDFPVQQIFRNARLLRIGAGSDEIMKFLIAREVLREVGRGR